MWKLSESQAGYKSTDSIQFFAGLSFSGAFLSAMFPVPGLTLLPCIPFAIWFLFNFSGFNKIKICQGIFLLLLMSSYYVAYLLFGGGLYNKSIVIRLLYFYSLAFIFIFGNALLNPKDFMRGFWFLTLPFAVISAVFGILKVVLQERGLILGPLWLFFRDSPFGYPYGSSLITDYNIYCVALLVALVGLFLKIINRVDRVDCLSILFSFLIILSIYVGGSRRAYFLLISFCVLSIFYALFFRKDMALRLFISLVLCFGVVHVVSDFMITSDSFGVYKVVHLIGPSEFIDGSRVFTYRLSDLIGSMSMENSFGLAARIERWKFALSLLQQNGWIFGQGFTYQDLYSCKFVECKYIDYPHNVFLSEWLLAGGFGLISAIVLAIFVCRAVVDSWSKMLASGVTFILFITLPSALISGDGVFSVPQVLAAIIMAFLYSSREING